MKFSSSAQQVCRRGVGIGMVVLACGQVLSVAAQDRTEKLRLFEEDRRTCLSGNSGQVFAPCMTEAKAVLAQRPGAIPLVSPEQLQRNSLMRCEALKGDDRTACVARMGGEGKVSGSVGGGGVLRELVTTEAVPGPAPIPASAGASN